MKQSKCSWVSYVKEILYNTGFTEICENQDEVNGARFVQLFEQRNIDIYMQSCHEDIPQTYRCRLYKGLKDNHEKGNILTEKHKSCTQNNNDKTETQ